MFVTCNLDCGAGCPLEAEIQDGKITSIHDNPFRGKYMTGCPKGYTMHRLLGHPERLLYPLRRKGPRGSRNFEQVSWDEALDTVADALKERDPERILRLGGSGACRGLVHNTGKLTRRFLSGLGSFTDTAGSYSSETANFMKQHLTGTRNIGIDVRTLLDAKFLLLLGFNPRDTRFGCETEGVLREIKRRGIPVIVIDPRCTSSVDLCGASWIPILPGTDAVLLSALLHEVLAAGFADSTAIERISCGFGEIASWVLGETDGIVKDPRWASPLCGIGESEIRSLAVQMMSYHPFALIPGLSVQRTIAGEEADRMGLVLQAALGNIGIPGGSAGCGQWNYGPGVPLQGISPKIAGTPNPRNVPVYLWPEAVDEHTLVYNVGGNFLGQGSDVRRSYDALLRPSFMVTHEQFMTPTARLSDIILPVSLFLERRDLCTSNAGLLLYSEKASEPAGEARDDYWIFSELARRLGFYEKFSEGRNADEWVEHILDHAPEEARRDCLSKGFWEIPQRPWVGLSGFVADPKANPLPTPSGRIELNPVSYQHLSGCRYPVMKYPETSNEFPLMLITPHSRLHIHSQHNGAGVELDRRVTMHPQDASVRSLKEGQDIRITSSQGEIFAVVHISDTIAPGVAAKIQGTWPVLDDVTGELLENDSVNMLTSLEPARPSMGSRTHSTAVQVEAADRTAGKEFTGMLQRC